MVQAVAVAVEVGALEGRFGRGCHVAAVGDEGSHLTHDCRVINDALVLQMTNNNNN